MKKRILHVLIMTIMVTIAVAVPRLAAGSGTTVVAISPAASITCTAGQIAVSVQDGVDLVGYEVHLAFTPGIIEITSLESGSFIHPDLPSPSNGFDNAAGTVTYGFVHSGHDPVTGSGDLFIIHFNVIQQGQSVAFTIDPEATDLVDSTYLPDAVEFSVANGSLTTSCQPLHSVFLPLILR